MDTQVDTIEESSIKKIERMQRDSRGSFNLFVCLCRILEEKDILTSSEVERILINAGIMLEKNSLENISQQLREEAKRRGKKK